MVNHSYPLMQATLFAPPKPETVSKLVVQRNDLVNARFALTTLEMRLFMAMLSRIHRDDTEFTEMHIPVTEVVALSGRRPSSNDYQQLKDMCALLAWPWLKVWYKCYMGCVGVSVSHSTVSNAPKSNCNASFRASSEKSNSPCRLMCCQLTGDRRVMASARAWRSVGGA